MADGAKLPEALLQQCPACQWLLTEPAVFERVFGDSLVIFGKQAAELEGRNVAEVLCAEAGAPWPGRIARVFRGETLRLRERRGEAAFDVALYPLRQGERICYAAGLAREVTPWNTVEQELRHTVLGALKAMEFERNMLSRFLHDSIGQNLTALGLQLDLMRMELETVSPESCERIVSIQQVLGEIMEDTREYSYELNPDAVERAGLRSAIDRLATRMRDRFPGTLRLNVDPSFKLERKVANALFQIAQEAVQNAVQHAGCSLIEIAVKSTRGGVSLEIKDNGRGFDAADLQTGGRGLGLLSMEHYAAEAGLDLNISSTPGSGTSVRAIVP
jgi:signal transduction histidine kinase